MKLLHFLIPALSNYFTLWGGGGSGGGGKSETKQQLDPTVQPFVKYGLEEAKGLYQTDTPQYYGGQTYIGPSAQTQSALQAAQNRALGVCNCKLSYCEDVRYGFVLAGAA